MAKKKKRLRKRRRRRNTHGPVGAPPGSLTVQEDAQPTRASVIAYDESEITEHVVEKLDDVGGALERWRVTWLDVVGLADLDTVRGTGRLFDLHPLALEDVVHPHQRAKVEDYPSGVFLVLRMPSVDDDDGLELEQVSVFFGESYVVTFQEHEGDCFEPIRNRLRQRRGRLRKNGADYLAYALLDAVIDAYFPAVEAYGERLEDLEDRILEDPREKHVSELHAVKRDLAGIRRAVWPLREAVNLMLRDENPLLTADTRLYLRDAYDHTIQLVELVESHREIASGLLDVYLSSVSNRMNEVMKVLTIIATIFIPLSFVAGLYGMNFDPQASPYNMPELGWRYGYPAALGVMLSIALGMLWFFRRKRWL
ncbi:MAG TPA: magnesium/cobalt transporter CorA [Sandaracinaceae bacterium LLY-WYZ-13_1]|nr:magnesium/cobalt transporter CorA [Sandaracinaceae bacterium LLY-WYZ-13_1]